MAVAGALTALWRYRHFVGGSVRRQFTARYVGSALGAGWNIIQPAITVLIYTVIFGSIMKAKMPGIDDKLAYGVYLCAGMFTYEPDLISITSSGSKRSRAAPRRTITHSF